MYNTMSQVQQAVYQGPAGPFDAGFPYPYSHPFGYFPPTPTADYMNKSDTNSDESLNESKTELKKSPQYAAFSERSIRVSTTSTQSTPSIRGIEEYLEKRSKNNQAAQKSRRQRKQREEDTRKENAQLKETVAKLQADMKAMKTERDRLKKENERLKEQLGMTKDDDVNAQILCETTNFHQMSMYSQPPPMDVFYNM